MAGNALLNLGKAAPVNALTRTTQAATPAVMPPDSNFEIMSDDDLKLYAGMAYGTPHEPFVKGELSYCYDGPFARDDFGIVPDPVPQAPSKETQLRYARAFKESLSDPVLSHGLDFSKLGMVSNFGWMPAIDRQPWAKALTRVLWFQGLYRPEADIAVSTQPFLSPLGSVDAHEMRHRGLSKLGVAAHDHHGLMNPFEADGIASDRYKQLQSEAADKIAKSRRMGPR